VLRRSKTDMKTAAWMEPTRMIRADMRRELKTGMKTALRMELMGMQPLDWRAELALPKTKERTRVGAWRLAAREPLVGVLRTRFLVNVTPGWLLGSVAGTTLGKEDSRIRCGCA